MVKVLYIAGWGRSGTTIVDNILNSHQTVFSTGELFYLWRRGLMQKRKCGCGDQFTRCALWREILHVAWGDRQPDLRHLTDLQQRVTRVRHTGALLSGPLSDEADEYRRVLTRLYHAIAEVTGAELIVDSSKVPSGAALLPQMRDIEPYLLHMVRDPRAVTYSWMSTTPQPDRRKPTTMSRHRPADSTLHWLVWNAYAGRLARTYPGRYRLLRYEDFAAAPRATVAGLLDFTGVHGGTDPFLDDTTVLLAANHTVSGNPGRFRSGPVELRPDDRWRRDQPIGPRLTVTALAWPMLHRYGYPAVTGRLREQTAA
ncbi:sulfotransferase [Actinoplanes sp. NBRC 101535]|uniref:sulfotransferase n=1 Tax=Actinoplanes sp. NBRC 101535 TaxID=3032196 RepID=UPI00249FF752|nr:sulfotransferase [Actinoplanes sp. NBRC 101535]GLY05107.1 sulfotransferase family protein [Actinoplanes sp. NBRC 101535]